MTGRCDLTTSASAEPPDDVPSAVLRMRWEQLVSLHWDVDPDEVARLLPAGLEPEIIEGRAWVGLVPFRMAGIRLSTPGPGSRSVPLPWSTFPETNVRTYVIGPDGGRGVYFHSLDVPFIAPTVVARLGFRLPYCTSTMRSEQRGSLLGTLAHRRWPRPGPTRPGGPQPGSVTSRVIVDIGDVLEPEAVTALDVALSARWALYTERPHSGLLKVDVHHPAWVLREARVRTLEDGLVAAAGYRIGARAPTRVRAADPVDVLVGRPYRVA